MGPIKLSRVKSAHAKLLADIDTTLTVSTREVEPFAKAFVATKPLGFKHRTGNLRRSTAVKVVRTSSGRIVKISNPAKSKKGAPYPWFLEHGTKRGITATKFLKKTTDAAFTHYGRTADRQLKAVARRFKRAR